MDSDLISTLALLLFVLLSGASSILTNRREAKKREKTPAPKPAPRKQTKPQSPQETYQGEYKQQQKAPAKQYQEYTKPSWQTQTADRTAPTEPMESPLPAEEDKSDPMREIFRELFNIELPKPEPTQEEIEAREEKKRRERIHRQNKKRQQEKSRRGYKSIPQKVKPVTITRKKEDKRGGVPVLEKYAAEAKDTPLRSAVVLSEIIQPPVSLRSGDQISTWS
ncbi:hypothetical protein GF373_07175 [bacterium]|nr:hypothetical protein [bacterium]